MKVQDQFNIQGRLRLQLRNQKQEIVKDQKAYNSIMISGRDLVARRFSGGEIEPIEFFAVGTGTNPTQANDTQLGNEIVVVPRLELSDPVISTEPPLGENGEVPEGVDPSEVRSKVTFVGDLDFEDGLGVLTEAALFNKDGVMYNRVRFDPITKTNEFQLTLIWDIIF